MTEAQKELMQLHGITVVPKQVYRYKEFRYERLEDAIRYAEIDAGRSDHDAALSQAGDA